MIILFLYLKKDNKIGLYDLELDSLIEPNYDKIEYLFENKLAVYKGEVCDIIDLFTNSNINKVVNNCRILKNCGRVIIFEKNNLFGLYIFYDRKNIVLENYDKITYIGDDYFELEKDQKKGICRDGQIIIPLKYDSIDYSYEKKYFALKKDSKCYELAQISYYYMAGYKVEYDNYYNEIQLLPDIIVFKDNRCTYIYNYKRELLSVMSGDRKISILEIPGKGFDKKILYCIDDVYYFFKNNKFEMAPYEECNLYVTTYESKNGDVVVSSFNKKEHDEVCREIEKGGEENIDKTISNIYAENWNLHKNYPVLVKRLEPKKNMD